MFDFQKLSVYQKSKIYTNNIIKIINDSKFDRIVNDQLKRASLSIMLNIAEGSSRFSNRDRRNFLVIARGSAFECVAILEYLKEDESLDDKIYEELYCQLEEISKMLYSLIKKLS